MTCRILVRAMAALTRKRRAQDDLPDPKSQTRRIELYAPPLWSSNKLPPKSDIIIHESCSLHEDLANSLPLTKDGNSSKNELHSAASEDEPASLVEDDKENVDPRTCSTQPKAATASRLASSTPLADHALLVVMHVCLSNELSHPYIGLVYGGPASRRMIQSFLPISPSPSTTTSSSFKNETK